MPEGVVTLAENQARRLEVAGSGGAYPEKGYVAARYVSEGKPFIHGCGSEWPGEGGAKRERVNHWDRLVGIWRGGEEGAEGRVEGGWGRRAVDVEKRVGCAWEFVSDVF